MCCKRKKNCNFAMSFLRKKGHCLMYIGNKCLKLIEW